jgi:hypothetical protein
MGKTTAVARAPAITPGTEVSKTSSIRAIPHLRSEGEFLCHASAWHINLRDDVRSLMSIEPNSRWFTTAHHWLQKQNQGRAVGWS